MKMSSDGSLSTVPRVSSGSSEGSDNSNTLYFGNLHPLVNQQKLEELCAYFGEIEQAKVIKDKGTGISAGYGFVKFAGRKAAEAAQKALNGMVYFNQELRVNWAFANKTNEDTSHHFHMFVGDLGQEVTDAMLYNFFSAAGSCSDARVMWDHATGRSKGYGFVSFRTREDAENAISKMHGQLLGSRRIRCGWAQHKLDEADNTPDYNSIDRADPTNTNVYVANISPAWTSEDITRHFSAFGPVAEVKLHKKGGYAFVRFEQHKDAVKAIVQMHKKQVGDRVLKCSWGRSSNSAGSSSTSTGKQNMNMLQPFHASMLPYSLMGIGAQPMMGAPTGQVPGMALSGQYAMSLAHMMLMAGQPASPVGVGGMAHMGGRGAGSMPLDQHAMYYPSGMYYGH